MGVEIVFRSYNIDLGSHPFNDEKIICGVVMGYANRNDRLECSKNHYQKNKSKYKQRAVAHKNIARKRNKEHIEEYLRGHPCIDCQESNIIVLEFDHVYGDKTDHVTTGGNKPWSLKRLKEEIEKCEIRCANCHRIATHNRRIKNNGQLKAFLLDVADRGLRGKCFVAQW